MKSSTKRLLSLVIVLAMALSMLPMISFAADAPTTLYVKPNANWLKDGARFAAYFFGNGDTCKVKDEKYCKYYFLHNYQ